MTPNADYVGHPPRDGITAREALKAAAKVVRDSGFDFPDWLHAATSVWQELDREDWSYPNIPPDMIGGKVSDLLPPNDSSGALTHKRTYPQDEMT